MSKHTSFAIMLTLLINLGCALPLAGHGHGTSSDDEYLPSVHLELVLQAESFFNGDSTYFAGMERFAENGYTIREAKVIVEGSYQQLMEYNLEIGSAACTDGGFMVMEAGILLSPHPYWKAGITKGHVLRGFEMYHECVHLLTAEKPVFAKKYSPCHPLGVTIEFEDDFGKYSGLLAQLVIAEGSGGTLQDECDINMGVHYRTPLQGLTLAGSYTFLKWNAPYSRKDSVPDLNGVRDSYEYFWVEEKEVYNGYRAIAGIDFNTHHIQARSEVYLGKGFKDLLDIPYYADQWADSSNIAKTTKAPFEDLKMAAFLIQAGYTIPTQLGQISSLQPYIQYQWWDQATHLEGDYQSAFLTFGMNFVIGPGNAKLRIDYQHCLDFANDGGLPQYGKDQQSNRLLARLQLSI